MNKLIIIGATGFIGQNFCKLLEKQNQGYIGIGSEDIDLTTTKSVQQLGNLIEHGDIIVNFAAISPTKDVDTLVKNMIITRNFVNGCSGKKLGKLILISSDAVYGDNSGIYSESSKTLPDSFHGIMHMTREFICRQVDSEIYSIVRPTNVYGVGDPHNSYGPNRFAREAIEHKIINLFGRGNSTRDFIYIDDVAKIINAVLQNDSSIIVNAVSGSSVSFREIALKVASEFKESIAINENGLELIESQKSYDVNYLLKLDNVEPPLSVFQGLSIYLNKLKS
jgi:UDP-glucose 4-epimerase